MNETIKGTIIGAIITGVLGVVGAIMAAKIGQNQGSINTLDQVNSQVVSNIKGDNNTVNINDVNDLITEYNFLYDENKALRKQNTKYVNDLTESEDNTNKLKSELDDTPKVELNDLSLKVDGDSIPINSTDARAKINGKEYFSREITEKLLSENQSIKVKDDTLYIGKVIAEQASLFDQYVVDSLHCGDLGTYIDSFGNNLPNSITLINNGAYTIYNLNNKYKYIKLSYATSEGTNLNYNGIFTIKADDNVVFTSQKVSKTTYLKDVIDIPINNCSLLKIEYSATNSYHPCIISDALLYN